MTKRFEERLEFLPAESAGEAGGPSRWVLAAAFFSLISGGIAIRVFGAGFGVTGFALAAIALIVFRSHVHASISHMRLTRTWDALFVRTPSLVLWSVALVGAALRLRAFLVDRALWLDEAYLARSLLDRDLIALVSSPLAHNQSAPPGFLVLVFGSVQAFGFQEWSLRLPTLLASLLTLILAVVLARRVFGTQLAALTFVTLISVSPFLIYYSQEFKQYAFDAMASVIALLVHSSIPQRRRPILVGFALALTALVSLPGAALVSIVVGLDVLRSRDSADLGYRLLTASITALGVLIHLVYSLRVGTDRAAMVAYWQGHSLPPDGGLFEQIRWHFDKALELMWVGIAHSSVGGTSVGVGETWLVLLFALVAASSLRKWTPAVEFALIAILGFVLLAQMNLYPLGTRLTLYIIPLFAVLFAKGFESLWADGPPPRSVLRIVLALVMLLPASVSADRLREPSNQSDIRLAVGMLNDRVAAGDVVVSNGFSRTAFNLYSDAGLIAPQFSVRWTSDSRGSAATVAEILDEVLGSDEGGDVFPRRVWVVASHRTRELQEGARAATSERALERVCDRIRSGVLVALYAEDLAGLSGSACDLED